MNGTDTASGLLSGAGFSPSIDSISCVFEGRLPHG